MSQRVSKEDEFTIAQTDSARPSLAPKLHLLALIAGPDAADSPSNAYEKLAMPSLAFSASSYIRGFASPPAQLPHSRPRLLRPLSARRRARHQTHQSCVRHHFNTFWPPHNMESPASHLITEVLTVPDRDGVMSDSREEDVGIALIWL